jgi:hypothetical protein
MRWAEHVVRQDDDDPARRVLFSEREESAPDGDLDCAGKME